MELLLVNDVKKTYTTRFGGNQVQALNRLAARSRDFSRELAASTILNKTERMYEFYCIVSVLII